MENSMETRDDFVQAMINYLSKPEKNWTEQEQADNAYEQLQFDFPLVEPMEIQSLSRVLLQTPQLMTTKYNITLSTLSGLVHCVGSKELCSPYFSALLAQYGVIHLYHMLEMIPRDSSSFSPAHITELVSICSFMSYSVLSQLTKDLWEALDLTEWLKKTMRALKEQENALLQIEWTRFLFIFRDRMIHCPETIPVLLKSVLLPLISQDSDNGISVLEQICRSKTVQESRSAKVVLRQTIQEELLRDLVPNELNRLGQEIETQLDRLDEKLMGSMRQVVSIVSLLEFFQDVQLLLDVGILRTLLRILTKSMQHIITHHPNAGPDTLAYQTLIMYQPVVSFLAFCSFYSPQLVTYCHRLPVLNAWLVSRNDQTLVRDGLKMEAIFWCFGFNVHGYNVGWDLLESVYDDENAKSTIGRLVRDLLKVSDVLANWKDLAKLQQKLKQFPIREDDTGLRNRIKQLLLLSTCSNPTSKTD